MECTEYGEVFVSDQFLSAAGVGFPIPSQARMVDRTLTET